jgi:hypothetical protein
MTTSRWILVRHSRGIKQEPEALLQVVSVNQTVRRGAWPGAESPARLSLRCWSSGAMKCSGLRLDVSAGPRTDMGREVVSLEKTPAVE